MKRCQLLTPDTREIDYGGQLFRVDKDRPDWAHVRLDPEDPVAFFKEYVKTREKHDFEELTRKGQSIDDLDVLRSLFKKYMDRRFFRGLDKVTVQYGNWEVGFSFVVHKHLWKPIDFEPNTYTWPQPTHSSQVSSSAAGISSQIPQIPSTSTRAADSTTDTNIRSAQSTNQSHPDNDVVEEILTDRLSDPTELTDEDRAAHELLPLEGGLQEEAPDTDENSVEDGLSHDLHRPPNVPTEVWGAIQERRQGQHGFRKNLLRAYGGRCAVTDCDAEPALEAAHIIRYSETGSHEITNGLLLRADVHTLFDLDLIRIEPNEMRIVLAAELEGTSYQELAGKAIRMPEKIDYRPSKEALLRRWESWEQTHHG
jgi:hypothetical protein